MEFVNYRTLFGTQNLGSSFHSGMSCAALEYLPGMWYCMHSSYPTIPRRILVRKDREERGGGERVWWKGCLVPVWRFMKVWVYSFMQLCNVPPTSNKREMTLKYTRVITMFVWWRVSKHNCYCSHSYRLILQYRQLCMLQSYEKR